VSGDGVELWRGCANAWECDEMGHMNVRHYIAKSLEGFGEIAARLGMADAFSARASSTLLVREQHVRFLREAHAGAALHMAGGVLEIGEDEVRVLQMLRHSLSGEPCATFVSRLAHVGAREAKPFPWSSRSRAAADAIRVELPPFAAPKGVSLDPVEPKASSDQAEALGLMTIARGVMPVSECDVFGRMRPDAVMGRFSDGAAHLFGDVVRTAEGRRIGGAMLEIRMLHLRPAYAGARFVLRSGLAEVGAKTDRIVHWLLDPDGGAPYAIAAAVGASFDLDARRIVPAPPEAGRLREAAFVEGLAL